MLAQTAFSFAQASPSQMIAFFGGRGGYHRLLRLGRLPRERSKGGGFFRTGEWDGSGRPIRHDLLS